MSQQSQQESQRDFWNQVQYQDGIRKGHYESYFFRANHPSKSLAFWVRYTIFSPKGKPQEAIGELWSIFFNGEDNKIIAAKSEHPISECSFSKEKLDVNISGSLARTGAIKGSIDKGNQISWDLNYDVGDNSPLLLLPESLYNAPLPKAKAVVGAPFAKYKGSFTVNGETHHLDDWIGSENHNWGEKHTDQYSWGQVAGFEDIQGPDENAEVFLEAITGKVKIGPILSPSFSILVLRVNQQDYLFNTIGQAFRAKGNYDFFEWNLSSSNGKEKIEFTVKAKPEHFVGLNYYNPPGGSHTCLNCKIASCELTFTQADGQQYKMKTAHRAAFEILTDLKSHGVEVVA